MRKELIASRFQSTLPGQRKFSSYTLGLTNCAFDAIQGLPVFKRQQAHNFVRLGASCEIISRCRIRDQLANFVSVSCHNCLPGCWADTTSLINVSANLSAARTSQAVKKAGNPLGWAGSSQATADRMTVNETNIGHFGVPTAGLHS